MTLLDQSHIKDVDALIIEMNNKLEEAKKAEPIPKALRRLVPGVNESSCMLKSALINLSLQDFSC